MKFRKGKRCLTILLAIVMALSSIGVGLYASASDAPMQTNIALLDSILSDRAWIMESLTLGKLKNNPYANVASAATQTSMLEEVLKNYKNDAAFQMLVDAMELYSNTGEIISGVGDNILNTLIGWFGSASGEGALETANKLVASTDELKYESIINEVLQKNYTASWGDTLFKEDMDLENLRQKTKVLNKLISYQTALRDFIGITETDSAVIIYDPLHTTSATFEISIQDYVGHFMDAYEEDLGTYLNSVVDIPILEGNEALKNKIVASSTLALVAAYERSIATSEITMGIEDIFQEYMCDQTLSVLKSAGKGLKLGSIAMDYAIMLEALQSQKNSTVDTMRRTAASISDNDLAEVFQNYADLANDMGDKKTLAYDSIVDYMRKQTVVTDVVTSVAGKGIVNLLNKSALKYYDGNNFVMTNSISAALAKASAITALVVWVADETTGIQQTAKKIYVCKYINRMIDEVSDLFFDDVKAYRENKTEENAARAINDLEFLKKLRLYGETCAYGSMKAQMDSWIGTLLGGGETSEYLARRYQASIDSYLGCTVVPVTNAEFTVAEGETLSIDSLKMQNGKSTTYAMLKKKDGTIVEFAEADNRLMGGIKMTGGTINVYNVPNGFFLPYLSCTGAGEVNLYASNTAIGEVCNSGTLNIHVKKSAASLEITDKITNSNTLGISDESGENRVIPCYMIENSASLQLHDILLAVKGNVTNNGSVTGKVLICGDGTQPCDNAYYRYGLQVLSGTGTYTDLSFDSPVKRGVEIAGTQSVTGSLLNHNTRIRQGKNIAATGNCIIADAQWQGDLMLRDFSADPYLTIEGSLYVDGNVSLPAGAECQSLYLTEHCETFTIGGSINVDGDLTLSGGAVSGSGVINLKGDLTVSPSQYQLPHLNLTGLFGQEVTLASALTVQSLNHSNRSIGNASITGTIYVTDDLYCSDDVHFLNANRIVLTKDAYVHNDRINGSIAAKDWNCSNGALQINGTLYASGNIVLGDQSNVTVQHLQQSDGVITIGSGAAFTCNEVANADGTMINGGSLRFLEDCKVSKITGGNILFGGDVIGSGEIKADELRFASKLAQSFTNSSTTETAILTLDNTSRQGFSAGSVIQVSEAFYNNSKKVNNLKNIVLAPNAVNHYSALDIDEDLVITGRLTVPKDTKFKVNGDVTLSPEATLTLEEGAQFLISGACTASSAAIQVESGAQLRIGGFFQSSSMVIQTGKEALLEIGDYFISQSDTVTADGELTVKGDAKLVSSTINAERLITFKGDLNASSCVWNRPNVSFAGKTPQEISGSAMDVNHLTVENPCKAGIIFTATVNYYGTLTDHAKNLTGRDFLVSKS